MSQNIRDAIAHLKKKATEGSSEDPAVAAAAAELEVWLESTDGQESVEMLKLAKERVLLGEDDGNSAHVQQYVLTGEGLRHTGHDGSTYGGQGKPPSEAPKGSPMTALEAVKRAKQYGNHNPSSLLNWLKGHVEAVATRVQKGRC